MWPLLLVTLFLYYLAFNTYSEISGLDIPDKSKFQMINKNGPSSHQTGALTEDFGIFSPLLNCDPMQFHYQLEILKADYVDYFGRRIGLLTIITTITPLLGLLGTVTGMLTTFKFMGQHNANSVDVIAAGVSEALVTTETGLIVAIPAMVMIMIIRIKQQNLNQFLNQLENYSILSRSKISMRNNQDV